MDETFLNRSEYHSTEWGIDAGLNVTYAYIYICLHLILMLTY